AEEAGHRRRLYPGEDRPHAEGDADDQSEGDDEESRHLVLPGPVSVPAPQPEVGYDHHEDPDPGHEHGADGEEVEQGGAGNDGGDRTHGPLDEQIDGPGEQGEDEEPEHTRPTGRKRVRSSPTPGSSVLSEVQPT